MLRLKDAAEIVMGQAPDGSTYNEVGEGLPLIAGAGDFGDLYPSPKKFTTAPNKKSKKNDIILCIRATIGDLNLADREYALGRGVAGITPRSKVDKDFLWYWLKGQKNILLSKGKGATFLQITKSDLEDLEIVVPELSTQKEISQKLRLVDSLLEKRRQSLAKLDQLAQSIFLDMFGDPVTNPKNWPKVKIGEIAEIKIGPFGTLLHKHDYISGGVPLINPTHINDLNIIPNLELTVGSEKYAKLSAYHMRTNDIVLGRRGEMGRCALVTNREDGYLCGTGSMFIRPSNKINPIFLVHLISSKQIKKELENKAQGVTMMNLNAGTISGLEIIYPKIEIQDKFELFLEKLKNTKERHKESLNKLELLQQSLSQKFFDQ